MSQKSNNGKKAQQIFNLKAIPFMEYFKDVDKLGKMYPDGQKQEEMRLFAPMWRFLKDFALKSFDNAVSLCQTLTRYSFLCYHHITC